MRPEPSPLWLVPAGVLVELLGLSYVAWGNWIPFAETINNPGALGVMFMALGGIIAFAGIAMRIGGNRG